MPDLWDVKRDVAALPAHGQDAWEAMSLTPADRKAWEVDIYRARVEHYEAEAQRQMNIFRVPGREAIHPRTSETTRAIRAAARRDARSLVNTYNRDLARMMQRELGPGVNRTTLAARARVWSDRRMDWKSRQVTLGNVTVEFDRAQKDFVQENPDLVRTTLWEAVPFTAAEPICQEIVDGNPYTTQEMQNITLGFGLHINCVHYWRPLVSTPGQVPFSEEAKREDPR